MILLKAQQLRRAIDDVFDDVLSLSARMHIGVDLVFVCLDVGDLFLARAEALGHRTHALHVEHAHAPDAIGEPPVVHAPPAPLPPEPTCVPGDAIRQGEEVPEATDMP